MKTRYIVCRAFALDVWQSLARQFVEGSFDKRFNEEWWTKEFAQLQHDLWPKYLQAGLNEMYYSDSRMKQSRIKLADEEFEDLPPTHLESLPDYDLYEDYLASDLVIEAQRGLKYLLMSFVLDKVSPERRFATEAEKEERKGYLEILRELCIKEFLHRDEFVHY